VLKIVQGTRFSKWLIQGLLLLLGGFIGYHFFTVPFFSDDLQNLKNINAMINASLGAGIALFAQTLSVPEAL